MKNLVIHISWKKKRKEPAKTRFFSMLQIIISQTVPVCLSLGDVVVRVAAAFIVSLQTVGDPVTTLCCLDTAPRWRAGELTSRAAAWTGCGGWLSSCRTVEQERMMSQSQCVTEH